MPRSTVLGSHQPYGNCCVNSQWCLVLSYETTMTHNEQIVTRQCAVIILDLTMHAMQSEAGTVHMQHSPLQPLPEEPPFYSSSGNDPAVHSSDQS